MVYLVIKSDHGKCLKTVETHTQKHTDIRKLLYGYMAGILTHILNIPVGRMSWKLLIFFWYYVCGTDRVSNQIELFS